MPSLYIHHDFPIHNECTDERQRLDSLRSLFDDEPLHDATSSVPALDLSRPDVPRSAAAFSPTHLTLVQPAAPRRSRSPYSRSHLRSRSSGAALASTGMARAHSWGGNPAAQATDINISSSIRTPPRARSPFRSHDDAMTYNTPQRPWYEVGGGSAIESIQEDSELDLTPRGNAPHTSLSAAPSRSSSLRRRPASPLYTLSASPAYTAEAAFSFGVVGGNGATASLQGPQRFNEAYPPLHHYASSSSVGSISSTPTSQRSRSPSISSLETIEDEPDLERDDLEAERLARFKLAAERVEHAAAADDLAEEPLRRRSLDGPRGFGFGRSAASRERKRWSVCGGERRGDLDLETIWED